MCLFCTYQLIIINYNEYEGINSNMYRKYILVYSRRCYKSFTGFTNMATNSNSTINTTTTYNFPRKCSSKLEVIENKIKKVNNPTDSDTSID